MLQKMTLDVLGKAVFNYDFKYMDRYDFIARLVRFCLLIG